MRAGRALIVAPHPDDEVLGCTSVLLARPCVVAHVTAGVPARTDGAVEVTADTRLQEAHTAAHALGVTVEARLQLGFEDQAAWRAVDALAAAIADVVEAVRPDEVYVPAYQNGHPDHDAVYVAGRLARQDASSRARWWVYSLYGMGPRGQPAFDHLDPGLFPSARRVALTSAQRSAKARALRCFATQVRPGSVLGRWLTHPADECFAPLPARAGPLPELPCYYETAFPDRCAVPAAAVRAELVRHTDS